MNQLLTISVLWLLLDIVALEIISRTKNGMNDIYDLYAQLKDLNLIASKIYVILHLMLFLPFTIPVSIYKIIKENKNGN